MYKRKKYFADLYGVSIRTIERKIDWIRKHESRYPVDSIRYVGNMPYIAEDVFDDALFNSSKVDAGLMPGRWRE